MSSSRCCLVLPRQAAALMPCTRGHSKVFSRRARSTSIIAGIAGASQAGPRSSRRGRSDGHAGHLIAGSALGSSVASPHTRGPILPGTRNFWDSCMLSACVTVVSASATVCRQCPFYFIFPVIQDPNVTLARPMKAMRARTKEMPDREYLRSTCRITYKSAFLSPSLVHNPHPFDLPEWLSAVTQHLPRIRAV